MTSFQALMERTRDEILRNAIKNTISFRDMILSDRQSLDFLRKRGLIRVKANCCFKEMALTPIKGKPGVTFQCFDCKRKMSVFKDSIFENNRQYLIGELIYITFLFSCRGTNTREIILQLAALTYMEYSEKHVNAFVQKVRRSIANYMNEAFYGKNSGVFVKAGQHGVIDESLLFTRPYRYWVVGLINSDTGEYRVINIDDRSAWSIYLAIRKWIAPGAILCSDGYVAYCGIAKKLKVSKHYRFKHKNYKFGKGKKSTSHIEGVWGNLKWLIKSRYRCIPTVNTREFLREAEFRSKFLNNLTNPYDSLKNC